MKLAIKSTVVLPCKGQKMAAFSHVAMKNGTFLCFYLLCHRAVHWWRSNIIRINYIVSITVVSAGLFDLFLRHSKQTKGFFFEMNIKLLSFNSSLSTSMLSRLHSRYKFQFTEYELIKRISIEVWRVNLHMFLSK